ncbi:MAG: hypothetical protein COT74_10365 [Bdellovibrionales bacterium CG10_big_fil_rev_8_21_14_0_10_45_34]|nr:MAG: hypothetical protein COT74_10365 [Bdellovibrionales bacterium CG10_big_fil_rev_8_21_14_0_10_45_34]
MKYTRTLTGLVMGFYSFTALADSVCGKHHSAEFQTQKFVVVDEDGNKLNVPVTARVSRAEPKKTGDHWNENYISTPVKVTKSEDGEFSTEAVKIKAKNVFVFTRIFTGCRGKIWGLEVTANSEPRSFIGEGGEKTDARYFSNNYSLRVADKSEKNAVFESNDEPHVIQLKRMEVFEGRVIEKVPSDQWREYRFADYKMTLVDGTSVLLVFNRVDAEEKATLEAALANGSIVRIYGDSSDVNDGQFNLIYGVYVDVIR